jgi:CHAT domain-containing protein/tetratricopeptide (TPR) repeat protein
MLGSKLNEETAAMPTPDSTQQGLQQLRQAFQQLVQAFLDRDHNRYAQLMMTALKEEVFGQFPQAEKVQLLLLWLISLQRLDQGEQAAQLGVWCLGLTVADPWSNALFRLSLGQTPLSEVLALAENDGQRCQAHYYAGARLVTEGRVEAAREAFAACVATGVACLESYLARGVSASEEDEQVFQIYQQVQQLLNQGQFPRALELARQGYELARQHLGETHLGYDASRANLAFAHRALGDLAAAEPLLCESLAFRRAALGEEHIEYGRILMTLARLYRTLGNLAAAEPLYRQAVAIDRRRLPPGHPDLAGLLNEAATLRPDLRDPQALALLQEALEIQRRAPGEQSPEYAKTLNNLGWFHLAQEEYAAAEPLLRRALAIKRSSLGERHPSCAATLGGLALLHLERGDVASAEPLFQQTVEIIRAAGGDCNLQYTEHLLHVALKYRDRGHPAKAEPLLRQLVEIRRVTAGPTHPDYAHALAQLGGVRLARGDGAECEALCRQARDIYRATPGARPADHADCLSTLAMAYDRRGDFDGAEGLLREVLTVRKGIPGEGPEASRAIEEVLGRMALLRDLDQVSRRVGELLEAEQYEESLTAAREACDRARVHLGADHPHLAIHLNNLANVYKQLGNTAAALPPCLEGLEIARASPDGKDPGLPVLLATLGNLRESQGEDAQAEAAYREALAAARTVLGENHRDFARAAFALGRFHVRRGDIAAGEPLLRQATAIHRSLLGPGHLDLAHHLDEMTLLHNRIGDGATALGLAREALDIVRAAVGERHPRFAHALTTLALAHLDAGADASAWPLLRQALDICRGDGGQPNYYREALDNLARCHRNTGNFTAAEPLVREAVEVCRATWGEDSEAFGTAQHNVGMLLLDMGDWSAAEPLLRRGLQTARRTVGETHPNYCAVLMNLAQLCAATSRYPESLGLMLQTAEVRDRLIGQVSAIASERQRAAYLWKAQFDLYAALSLVRRHLASDPAAVRAGLDLLLRRKAVGAEALGTRRDAVQGGKYPELQPRLRELSALRARIVQKALAGPGAEGGSAHLRLLGQWNEEREKIEAELARGIPEMDLHQRLALADRCAVALALPPGAALVEFVRFEVTDFEAVPARGEQLWQPGHYLAFVMPAGEPDRVQMFDLNKAGPIDRLVAAFRTDVTGEAERRNLSRGPARPTADADATPGECLRAAVFDPLTEALGACRRLLLSPDGDLTRLPFEALPLPGGGQLIDAYRISYVSTGRDVLRFGAVSGRRAAEPVVAADPDFNLSVGADAHQPKRQEFAQPAARQGFWSRLFRRRSPAPAPKQAARPAPASQPPPRLSRDLDRSRYHFSRLPGAHAEGERVGRRLGVKPLLAGAAVEGQLKTCRSPCILHLATHGFFLPDLPLDPNRLGRNLELLGDAPTGLGPLSGPGMENPMLRSGLALAGANTFLRGGTLPDEAEDGLLTAEDVTGLDLLDTELVVLSACETGLGEVHAGEGVLGLRRAFIVAGAKTLVMSLWKVPDLATAFLMDRFYDNLLTRDLDRDLALSRAQRATRDATVGQLKQEWLTPTVIERLAAGNAEARRRLEDLAAKPDDHRPFEHPVYWGAFICQGDTAPLRSGSG